MTFVVHAYIESKLIYHQITYFVDSSTKIQYPGQFNVILAYWSLLIRIDTRRHFTPRIYRVGIKSLIFKDLTIFHPKSIVDPLNYDNIFSFTSVNRFRNQLV